MVAHLEGAGPQRPPATRQRNQGPAGASCQRYSRDQSLGPVGVVFSDNARVYRHVGRPDHGIWRRAGMLIAWSGQLRRSSVKRRRRRIRRPGCTLRAPKRRHSGTTTAQRAPFETTVVSATQALLFRQYDFGGPPCRRMPSATDSDKVSQRSPDALRPGAVLVTPRDGALGRREHVRGEVEQRGRPKPHDRPLGSTTITGAITSRPPLRCLKRIACCARAHLA